MDNKLNMMGNQDRKNLISVNCQTIIKRMVKDKRFKDHILTELSSRVAISKITNIFNSLPEQLISLDFGDIYWLAKFLNQHKQQYGYYEFKGESGIEEINLMIDIDRYFTIEEKFKAEKQIINVKEEKRNILIIDNVQKITDEIYVSNNYTYGKIHDDMKSSLMAYNFDIQREPTIVNLGIAVVRIPTLYRENVDGIKTRMKNGKFKPNTITYNIPKTGDEQFEYNEETHQLIIYTPVEITDGYHRATASEEVVDENEQLRDGIMFLRITNYDVYEAYDFMDQESQGIRIDNEKQKTFVMTQGMNIAKELNKFRSPQFNIMHGMLSDNAEEVFGTENKYCLLSTVADVINDKYSDALTKPYEISSFTKYLVNFYNEFAGQLSEAFELSIPDSRKIYTTLHGNMFILTTYLAIKLYKKDDWQIILSDILQNIDYSVNNELWKELGFKGSKITKNNIKNIYQYVDDLVSKYSDDIAM